jgi:hypothetical protein
MRTTVTLDEDVAVRLRGVARERGISFKEALNTTLRVGLGDEAGAARPFRQTTYCMRLRPGVNLDKALQLAAALEDEETIRKLELRK